MLVNTDDRAEAFYVPDKRFEESKKDPEGKKKYGAEDFHCDEQGNYTCPAGYPMRHVGTFDGADGARLDRYLGTACEGCQLKLKCTKAAVRSLASSQINLTVLVSELVITHSSNRHGISPVLSLEQQVLRH